MPFPTDLTNTEDEVTEIVAAHLNALEAKIGVDGSAVATSLDYLLKNASSLNPGHKHTDAWPVGSVFISVVATNPNTLLGYGTWSAFGTGRMLVGIDAGQAEFDTVEETGGAKTKNLAHTHTGPSHTHSLQSGLGPAGAGSDYTSTTTASGTGNTGSGGSATQDVLNPYIVVYMWKRTA